VSRFFPDAILFSQIAFKTVTIVLSNALEPESSSFERKMHIGN